MLNRTQLSFRDLIIAGIKLLIQLCCGVEGTEEGRQAWSAGWRGGIRRSSSGQRSRRSTVRQRPKHVQRLHRVV